MQAAIASELEKEVESPLRETLIFWCDRPGILYHLRR